MTTYLLKISKITLVALFLALSLIACTISSFEVKANNASVQAGDITIVTVDIVRNNFDSAVSLSVANLPSDITASFNEDSSFANSVSLKLSASATTEAGNYTIKVFASSGELLEATSFSLSVSEAEVSDTAPTVSISSPDTDIEPNNADFTYDGFDDAKGMWYKDLTFVGTASDTEDGTLTGESLVWTTNQTTLQVARLGTGESLTARIYSDECFGTSHLITLTVTDSDGNVRTAVRRINIWTLC